MEPGQMSTKAAVVNRQDPSLGLQKDRTLSAQLVRVALAYALVVGTWMLLSPDTSDELVLTVKTEAHAEAIAIPAEVNSEIRATLPEVNPEIRATMPELLLDENELIQTNI